ncbi:xanthine dehydrogenase, partial [Butyricicoccus sp. 1XD8-22]
MLPAYVEYYRPGQLREAIELFQRLKQENKAPIYWSGGTEILTLGRLNIDTPRSVIDIKGIPETMVLEETAAFFTIGSAVPLTTLEEENRFPLLTAI